MQAIVTKFLPATNFNGARIKARAAAGSITVPFEYDSASRDHDLAAIALVRKMKWYPCVIVHGGMPDVSGDCYVILPKQTPRVEPKDCIVIDDNGKERYV